LEVARNTTANNISEYDKLPTNALNKFKKGTPAHIKAAIVYNRLLTYYGIDQQYEKINDGEKIKYVMLKQNPLQIDSIAAKGHNDPPEIVELVNRYIDMNALFDNELRNKLQDFYTALGWKTLPTDQNQNSYEFFTF